MRSQLTRTIFRRLLSSEPILFRPCPRALPRRHVFLAGGAPRMRIQKRSLFGFGAKEKRQPREPQLDPGLVKMTELSLMDKIHARPPPRSELVEAFNRFFKYKEDKREPVNNSQAVIVLKCFRHLMKSGEAEGEDGDKLNLEDLRVAAKVLTRMPDDEKDAHTEFAKELYTAIVPMVEDVRGVKTGGIGTFADVQRYTEVLAQSGSTLDAKTIVLDIFAQLGASAQAQNKSRDRLRRVLIKGFAQDGNEEELLKMIKEAASEGMGYTSPIHLIMTEFYAKRNDIEATKRWYSKPLKRGHNKKDTEARTPESLSIILRFCIRNNELDWCKTIFRSLLQNKVSKAEWDIVFQWAAGTLGKGVEDVERMMEVMKRANEDDPEMRPDISTINGLVSLAVSANDQYLAERYIALGLKHGIRPNAETYIHQLHYRVDVGDLTGAQASYEALQSEEILVNEDVPAINKYIRALCAANPPNYTLITSICADLDERKARLEAPTVSSLAVLYLDRGEIPELIDMLQTQSYHYTRTDRASIRDAMLAYTLDPATPTGRAWDSYTVFRQIFDETPISIRTQAMNEFFRRRRSDMALHTFGHMRAHIRTDTRPILETYVQCFEGLALCEDYESVRIVYNMLKMDSSIEPNTALYNSLMLAYASCGEGDRALDFWKHITNSSEGPSYRSLEIVFLACETKPFGDKTAREIWTKMRRMEIEITENVLVAYVCALAGQGQLEDAKAIVDSSEKDFGFKPDKQILGMLYNAVPGQNRKDLVEAWGKDLYSDAWADLEKLGQIRHEEGHRLFNMPRIQFKA